MLGTWTQVPMLVWQVLYPLEPCGPDQHTSGNEHELETYNSALPSVINFNSSAIVRHSGLVLSHTWCSLHKQQWVNNSEEVAYGGNLAYKHSTLQSNSQIRTSPQHASNHHLYTSSPEHLWMSLWTSSTRHKGPSPVWFINMFQQSTPWNLWLDPKGK